MRSILRAYRHWRLHVWSCRLTALEIKLDCFKKHPWDTATSTENAIGNKLRNKVARAKYNVSLISGLMNMKSIPKMELVNDKEM